MSKRYDDRIAVQMEHAIAAALLVDADTYFPEISGVVFPEDFQSSMAATVFRATAVLLKDKRPADLNTIQMKAAELKLPLDEQFCKEAMEVTPTFVNISAYAEAVHAQAVAKAEDDIGMRIMMGELDSGAAVAELQNLMRQKGTAAQSPQDAANSMMDFINSNLAGKKKPYVPTGFYSLDKILSGGLVSGGMITLAARPGTGKTTAGICIAENIAAQHIPVLYISLEMTSIQIWTCRVANYSGVSRSEIYTGDFTGTAEAIAQKSKRTAAAVEALYSIPFYIRDMPSSVDDIEREARAIPNIGLIVVDHLGLVRPSEGGNRSRYEVMTDIAHRLKQLALSLKIPILCLCQLNRQSVERNNKKPTMADLRDSGAIEEDSDSVILLFRDDSQSNTAEAQKIRFIVDKNRHGMTGYVDMNFIGSMSRISS